MPKKGYKQTPEHILKGHRWKKGEIPKGALIFKKGDIRLMGNTWGFKKGGHASPKTEFKKGINQKMENNGNWKGGFGTFTRDYGRHKISFEHPGCAWHHVNMMFMVACPEIIHNKCLHHVLGTTGIHAHFLEGVLG